MAYRTVPSASVYGRRIPAQSIAPPPTKETFRDLLVFEERLKQNAERLQRQRRKYEAFLIALILTTLAFAYKSFIAVSMYTYIHYLWVGCFLVCTTTLVLFFATGMYSEKISYAYKFIPQTNRALRSLNMYLNTRRRSIPSPFRFFRPPPPGPSPPTSPPPSSRSSSGGHQLAPIPPSTNPRGELIFSAKVSPTFREGYERYRSEWERRRNTPPPPTASVGYAPGRKSWFAWRKKDQPPVGSIRPVVSRTPTPEVLGASSSGLHSRSRGRDSRAGTSSSSASRQSSRRRGGGSIGGSPTASRSSSPGSRGSSRASTPELMGGGGRKSGSSSGPEGEEGSLPNSPSDEEAGGIFASAAGAGAGGAARTQKGRLVRGDSFSELIALQENSAML